jgi:glucose/mannose transport system permease protein
MLSLAGIGASLEGTDYGLRMAGVLLTSLPALIVFLRFGERFAESVVGRT